MRNDIWLGVLALTLYIFGGAATFTGMGLFVFMKGRDLWSLGEGRSISYLFLFVGPTLCILGVLLMRIFRNR